MFKQFFEAFWPKAVDYVAEQGLSNVLNINNYEHILEILHKNLKLLSAKAFDVEKEIKNGEDSGRKKRKREVEEWLRDVKSIETEVDELGGEAESEGFIMRFLDGGKAAQLNEQVENLLQQSLNFGEPLLDARGSRGQTLLTDEMIGVAFKENSEKVLKFLEDRKVSKIGVYGMGGVGKTTLAKHIYNRLVQEYEGRVVWVTVSQEFTNKSLQDKIARFLGVELSNEDEEAIRAARLDRFLSQKKISVLILDDVWENIDMKKVGCTFAVECCRLIITTRSVEVCHRIGCKKLIPVVKLGKDEAWKLFNETLENETKLGPQVEEIAKSMAEVCDGLPLGIITVAGSMKGETTIHTWKNASADLKDCVAGRQNDIGEVDEVFRVLKYSFDRLKRNDERDNNELNTIQQCFMYCSLYPEDHEIDRDGLVGKFISGGLLDERRSRRAQIEQGHSILDKLVNVCLLESCDNYFGKECVKMHDLVRSMALKILSGGIWLKVIPESFFSKMQGLCTLDLCGNHQITMLPNSVSDLTSLKALLLEYCLKLEKVPYLGKLKALRELNLSHTSIEEAPQGLEELLNLKFLSIYATRLKLFPRGVLLKLVHLQHLNLPPRIQVEIEEIENLKELEELGGGVKNVSDFNWFIRIPKVHGTCSYKIGVSSKNDYLGFKNLKDLGGKNNELVLCESNVRDEKVLGKDIAYLTIGKCEGLSKCFVDDLAQRFDNPTSLSKLKISRCGGIEWILRSDVQGSQTSDTLEEIWLQDLDDLKGVVMMQRGGIGPSNIAPAQPAVFSSLKILHIGNCNKMRKVGLPVASGLPNLELIEIRRCEELEEIFEEDEGRDSVTTLPKLQKLALSRLPRLKKVGLAVSEVPNLELIEIRRCEELEEIFEEDEGRDSVTTLPKLQSLELCGLSRLKKVGLAVSEVPNLEIIDIEDCGEMEETFEEENEGTTASIVPTLTFPKLTYLSLSNLPRLKSVSKAAIISNSIEKIHIKSCPRLMKKLPVHFDDPTPPPNLGSITVEREWWESLDWNSNPNVPQLLQPFLDFHVEKLVQQRLNFGELLLDVHGTRGEILLTNGMVGKAFDENLETVLKLLENRQVLSIGIYGMGGIGKTTLAQHIYNQLVQEYEGRVVWVTVSQEFTIKSLQDKIARFLGVKLGDEDEEAIRAGRLNRILSQKKISVLILDDVWEKIDMRRVGCTFSLEGCRLIITARSLEVCRQFGCKKLIPVVKLCKDEAWKLFNETLENETKLGPQVEEIAKSMAEVCDGLPLGIVTVAGSMKGETSIHTWKNASADLKDCVAGRQNDIGEVDEVFRVFSSKMEVQLPPSKIRIPQIKKEFQTARLEKDVQIPLKKEKLFFHEREELLSLVKKKPKTSEEDHHDDDDGVYDMESPKDPTRGVPHEVPKRCIEHCKLFLPDCEFDKDKLVRMWIAEGCIDLGVTKRMEDVGNLYFDALVEEEVIATSKFDNVQRQMKYKFNKSQLGLLEQGNYLRINASSMDGIHKEVLHLTWQCKRLDRTFSDALKDLKQLHTLVVHEDCSASISQLPSDIFLGLRLLKTLDLSRTHISEVPGSIGKLESLQYLDLSETPIKRLPESLDRLYSLQTLNLKACVGVTTLPRGFGRLVNLRHLDLDVASQLKSMPRGMGNLIDLQTLQAFIVGKNDGCGIGELKNMNEITGSFCISRLENVTNAKEAKEAALCDKRYIEKLELRWRNCGNDNFQDTVEILESLQPHFGLKELQLTFYGGSNLPRWISNPGYTDLSSMTLYKCINCDTLPSIGELPSLKILHVFSMENLRNINTVFCRNHEKKVFNAFPRLEKLTLDSMPLLEEWTGVEDGDFPCLRHVSIKYCPKLRVLPSLLHLSSLEHLEISNCMQLISLPVGSLPPSLDSLIIRSCPGLNERCRKDGGVDWSKIASVGNIWIDLEKISLN